MRYVYFDDIAATVHILPEESTEHGVQIGMVSDSDFGKIRTNFLVQALFNRAKIDRSGLDIQIVIGPSQAP